jgi:hypothetical protein
MDLFKGYILFEKFKILDRWITNRIRVKFDTNFIQIESNKNDRKDINAKLNQNEIRIL